MRGETRLEREERRKNREQICVITFLLGVESIRATRRWCDFPLTETNLRNSLNRVGVVYLSTREISRAGISLRKNCRAIRLRRNYAKHSETLENRMEKRANDSFDPLRRNFVTSELLSIFCSYCDEIKHLDTLVVIWERLVLYWLLWTSSKVVWTLKNCRDTFSYVYFCCEYIMCVVQNILIIY